MEPVEGMAEELDGPDEEKDPGPAAPGEAGDEGCDVDGGWDCEGEGEGACASARPAEAARRAARLVARNKALAWGWLMKDSRA
jgi:hypothetical protein